MAQGSSPVSDAITTGAAWRPSRGLYNIGTRALFVAILLASRFAAAAEVQTAPRPESSDPQATALADQACREFGDANVPRDVVRQQPNSKQARNGPDTASTTGDPASRGARSDRGRDPLGKIPFVISVLCQDEYTNQNSIAQLYLTLKAKPPPPETAGMGSPPPPSPSRPNTSGLVSESRGEALADLQGAAERFIRLRVDNEIENNLREKTYTTVDNTRPMRVEFSNMLTAVTTGNYGSAFAEDSRAEQELSAAYRKVHQRVEALGVPSDLANLEETQSAWLAYRKAWLSYVAVANPAVPRKGVASFLTLERAAQLKAYYATGDR